MSISDWVDRSLVDIPIFMTRLVDDRGWMM
jgi:hypothetical protein